MLSMSDRYSTALDRIGEKCEFHRHTVKFLGYVISPGGVAMVQDKVAPYGIGLSL